MLARNTGAHKGIHWYSRGKYFLGWLVLIWSGAPLSLGVIELQQRFETCV